MNETEFTIFWIWTAVFIVISYGLFFWFAVRCGMLRDQDRSRYLPLWAEPPKAAPFGVQSSKFGVGEQEAKPVRCHVKHDGKLKQND